MSQGDPSANKRLIAVTLDEASIGRGNPDQEHERQIAIWDLVEENSFGIEGHAGGPYSLILALHDKKLLFDVRSEQGGVTVVIDPASMQHLGGASLDYQDGLQGAGFHISNPNAQRTCGCGQSFS